MQTNKFQTKSNYNNPYVKTRKIMVADMIDTARREVIKNDIELEFLRKLKQNIDNGKVRLSKSYDVKHIEESTVYTQDQYTIALERLHYLKDLRDIKRIDSALKSAESAPEIIEGTFNSQ